MIRTARRKPLELEALLYTGKNADEARVFMGGQIMIRTIADGMAIVVPTLEGELLAPPDTWILKGVAGEVWPVRPDIFAQTYDLV
ncbi:MAG: hypothetical protein ACR2PR_03470 [Pseudohongiellaceae bacterium]